jgi:glycosyltransferase involved in cell wall biosynthesis
MKRKDIHLVFMGIKHPNPVVPEMKMARDALELAKSLGIMDKHVFANMGWLPYGDRQNFLLDATIGTSSHFDNLETRYAFRTRILDYIWAGLPILTTEGDSFAALVKKRDLGCVVPYQNAEATAQAIESMVDNPQRLQAIRENLAELRPEFLWENTTKPILRMIEHLQEQPRGSLTFRDAGRIGKFLARKVWLKLCKP